MRAQDQTGAYFVVYSTVFEAGYPTSVAVGDLDHDGAAEIVVGRDRYELRYVGIDPIERAFRRIAELDAQEYMGLTRRGEPVIELGDRRFAQRLAELQEAAGPLRNGHRQQRF